MKKTNVKTRYGSFTLEASEQGLYRLRFPRSAKAKRPAGSHHSQSLAQAAGILRKYVHGSPASFKRVPVDLSGYTPFEKKVLRTLAKVRPGDRISYQELAKRAGYPRASRAVGSVMRKNRLPIILPCHRVVRSGGALGGYSGGMAWKRKLLAIEAGEAT
ncbi:MAG: methylated-DNA--[protein]-cysteine S-methyltransferase [Candidatus Omnitrophota bacterium]|nr:methylated-DNA--[protein]-cysteine S-methyltransferase [Candidatus Omnitrophota bacterium]